MPDALLGPQRAVIVAVDDPEERARYRVRVFSVHDDEIPVENLPWAELLCHGGKGWGDIPHYEINDLVFVLFEGGDREHPVILGGWLTAPGGTSELPSEQTEDYVEDRRRWVRKDRAGNLIEMSEKEGELHVKLKSGEVTIKITQDDNSVLIEATGPVQVKGDVITVEAASQVNVKPKCIVGTGGGKVLTDVIIPACLFTGAPFVGNANLEVSP